MSSKFNKVSLITASALFLAACNSEPSSESSKRFSSTINEKETANLRVDINFSSYDILEGPGNGDVSFNTSNNTIRYTPNDGFFGEETFKVRIRNNNTVETITYRVSVNFVNDAPVIDVQENIVVDYHIYDTNGSLSLGSMNISDEETPNENLTINFIVDGQLGNNGSIQRGVDIEGNETDEIIYVFPEEWITSSEVNIPDSVTENLRVRVTDDGANSVEGVDSAEPKTTTKDVTITINHDNSRNPPVYQGETSFTVLQGEEASGNVSFSVPDGYDIRANSISVTDSSGVDYYTNGSFSYSVPTDASPDTAISLTARATNKFGATTTAGIVINVEEITGELTAIDQVWTAQKDTMFNSKTDENVTGASLYNDELGLPETDFTYTIVKDADHGTFLIESAQEVIFKYMADEFYIGQDSVNLRIAEGDRSVVANIVINVEGEPEPAEWTAPVFETDGNVHIEKNLMEQITNVNEQNVTFEIVDNTTVNGSEYSITEDGLLTYVPAPGQAGFSEQIQVSFSDQNDTYTNNKVTFVVSNKLVKLYDINNNSTTNVGNLLNPYNDISVMMADLQNNNTVFFCSGETTMMMQEIMTEGVEYIGYSPSNKHDYVAYCENANATEKTRIITNEDINLFELANGITWRDINIVHNGNDSAVFTGTDVSDVTLEDFEVSNNRTTIKVMDADMVENLSVRNQSTFRGEVVYNIMNLKGQNLFENVEGESIQRLLNVETIADSNTVLDLSQINVLNYNGTLINVIDTTSTDVRLGFEFTLHNSEIRTNNVDASPLNLELNHFTDPMVQLNNNNITLMSPLVITFSDNENAVMLVENNEFLIAAGGIITANLLGKTNHHIEMGLNTINTINNNNPIESPVKINVTHDNTDATYRNDFIWKQNSIENDFNRAIQDENWFSIELSNMLSNRVNRLNVLFEESVLMDDNNNAFFLNAANNNDELRANLTFKSLNFVESLGANVSFNMFENNMQNTCINFENSELNNLDLFNEDPSSDIRLYDPNNNGSASIRNRNLAVGSYNVQGYTYTVNACSEPVTRIENYEEDYIMQ